MFKFLVWMWWCDEDDAGVANDSLQPSVIFQYINFIFYKSILFLFIQSYFFSENKKKSDLRKIKSPSFKNNETLLMIWCFLFTDSIAGNDEWLKLKEQNFRMNIFCFKLSIFYAIWRNIWSFSWKDEFVFRLKFEKVQMGRRISIRRRC